MLQTPRLPPLHVFVGAWCGGAIDSFLPWCADWVWEKVLWCWPELAITHCVCVCVRVSLMHFCCRCCCTISRHLWHWRGESGRQKGRTNNLKQGSCRTSYPPVPVRLCQMRDNEAQPGAEESLEPKHTVAEPFAHRSFIIRWPRFMRCKPLGCELHRAMGESITKGTSIDTSVSICRRRRRRRVVIIFISNVVVRCVTSTLRHNVWGFHYEHEVSLCARMQFCR